MTREECIKILAMLGAFYGGGKTDPVAQVGAWYTILYKYDFADAEQAVLTFAENDLRDYATFPAVGKIVGEIRAAEKRRKGCVQNIIRAIAYGRGYDTLTEHERALISEERFKEWSAMDAHVFAERSAHFAELLTDIQERLRLEGGSK